MSSAIFFRLIKRQSCQKYHSMIFMTCEKIKVSVPKKRSLIFLWLKQTVTSSDKRYRIETRERIAQTLDVSVMNYGTREMSSKYFVLRARMRKVSVIGMSERNSSCVGRFDKTTFSSTNLYGSWCPLLNLKNGWGKTLLSLNKNIWIDLQSIDVCVRRTDQINGSSERCGITQRACPVETTEVLDVGWLILRHVMTWRSFNYIFLKVKRKQTQNHRLGHRQTFFFILDIGKTFSSRSVCSLIEEFLFRSVSDLMRLINNRTYYHWRMEEVPNKSKWYDVNSDPFEKRTLRYVITFH